MIAGQCRPATLRGMTFTKGQVDRLGDRLRASPTLSESELDELQELRREYDAALAIALNRIADQLPQLHPTSRLKTVQTLVAKLRREPTMNLSQVQDIAGIRVVESFSLADQDRIARKIASLFDQAKEIDRRARPSFGYRALHLVVRLESKNVEVQIRTALQDRWAQILERLADYWGRQIRYGDPPDDPTGRVATLTRSRVVELTRRLSPLIAGCEEASAPLSRPSAGLVAPSTRFCEGVDVILSQLARLDIRGGVVA